ncbi:hypothetical protein DFH28DRAFT_959166 [Melampsora americana]|nr:hypothetical protein DFH28DRAFT_959166 [Melampsora americana]
MPPKTRSKPKPKPKRVERILEVKPMITLNDHQTPSESSSPTPNPAQESVTSRPSGKSISSERIQESNSIHRRSLSTHPIPTHQPPSLATKINILNMCVNVFWSDVLSTPFESREPIEGSIGFQLSKSEKVSWDAATAVQSMWDTSASFIEHIETNDSSCSDAILKYNLASLFHIFLTSPYEIGLSSIEKFLSSLIKEQEFIKDSKQERLLLKFLIEYELQKLILIGIQKIQTTPLSLFSDLKVKKKTLLDFIQLLDQESTYHPHPHHHNRNHKDVIPEFEPSTIKVFEELYQSVYQSLLPLRNKPQKIAELHPYSKFIDLIIDLVCSRFPEYVRPTKHSVVQHWGESSSTPRQSNSKHNQLQVSGKKSSDLVPVVRISPRGSEKGDQRTSKGRHHQRVSQPEDVESEEDDDSSFCEEVLVPSSNRQGTSVPASYDGPHAGSSQDRHHKNVADEVAGTANFVNFAEEQLAKDPKFFSARHSHPSGISQVSHRQSSKPGTSVPSGTPKKKFNERKSNAKQISFDDTQITIQEDVTETMAGVEDHQGIEVAQNSSVASSVPQSKSLSDTEITVGLGDRQGIEVARKSPVKSSAPQSNSPSKDDQIDVRFTEEITQGAEEVVDETHDPFKDQGKGKGKSKEATASKSLKRGRPPSEANLRPKKQYKEDHKSDDSDDQADESGRRSEKIPWKKGQSRKGMISRSKSQRPRRSSKSENESTSKHFEDESSVEKETIPSPEENKKASSRAPSTKPFKRRCSSSVSSHDSSFSKPIKGKPTKVGSPANQKRRQRWTDEQEELLIREVVKYCERYDCMAHILKRHGSDGSQSKTLANRTNVMLKDKAIQVNKIWL